VASAKRTTTGVVVVVACTVVGVKGACAYPAVAANASPLAQSADLICVLFMSNAFLFPGSLDALNFSL